MAVNATGCTSRSPAATRIRLTGVFTHCSTNTPDLGLLYEYEQAEPCGVYDAMDRAISSLTYRSPTGPKDPA
jgi:hypothetical protein